MNFLTRNSILLPLSFILMISFVIDIAAESDISTLTKLLLGTTTDPIRVRRVDELTNTSILDFIGLVELHKGYTAEEHRVITEDGYILTLHRINGSPLSPRREGKPVIFLQHGFGGSTDVWVMLGPEHSLALQLADAGYDVWMGNYRGNTYSKLHLRYSPKYDVREFWAFGLDEIGKYDMKAFVVYILEHTNNKPITCLGYSFGASFFYIFLDNYPEYNNKINLLISMAPMAYFSPSSATVIKPPLAVVIKIATLTFRYEVFPVSIEGASYVKENCVGNETNNCQNMLNMGVTISTMNTSNIPTIFTYMPAGNSIKTIEHMSQIMSSGKLQRYDYRTFFGLFNPNIDKYNQSEPPEYNLSSVTAPVAIIYSDGDSVTTLEDIGNLTQSLKNVVKSIFIPKLNHMDYVWSKYDKTLVYDPIIKFMNEFVLGKK